MINEISIELHDDVYRNDHHITFRRWFHNSIRNCDANVYL